MRFFSTCFTKPTMNRCKNRVLTWIYSVFVCIAKSSYEVKTPKDEVTWYTYWTFYKKLKIGHVFLKTGGLEHIYIGIKVRKTKDFYRLLKLEISLKVPSIWLQEAKFCFTISLHKQNYSSAYVCHFYLQCHPEHQLQITKCLSIWLLLTHTRKNNVNCFSSKFNHNVILFRLKPLDKI